MQRGHLITMKKQNYHSITILVLTYYNSKVTIVKDLLTTTEVWRAKLK